MSIFAVDVEADGPCPGLYSMVSFGAVMIKGDAVGPTFFGQTAPISLEWIPEALAISGVTREQHLAYDNPQEVMIKFADWILLQSVGYPVFISDNPAFDWQFINYYFHRYLKRNPFGFSARRLGDFYAGLENDWFRSNNWRYLRKTKHTHNPVDDASGVAEALIAMAAEKRFTLPK
jgi:hypothetical protein